jgi:hypothetical protein
MHLFMFQSVLSSSNNFDWSFHLPSSPWDFLRNLQYDFGGVDPGPAGIFFRYSLSIHFLCYWLFRSTFRIGKFSLTMTVSGLGGDIPPPQSTRGTAAAMTSSSNGGADGDRRMKLLLSLIETAEETSTDSLVAMGTAAKKFNGSSGVTTLPLGESAKASKVSEETRRNLVTPTPATQAQAQVPPIVVKNPPGMVPLARPPTLVSTAMFLSQSKPHQHPQGLKMPPPLATPNSGFSLSAIPWSKSRASPPIVYVGTIKPSLALPTGMLLRCLRESVPGESAKEASPSQLHAVCCWGKDPRSNVASIIGSIVARDHMAIRRECRITQTTHKAVPMVVLKNPFARRAGNYEPYGFPLNLALLHQPQNEPDLKTLRLLAELGPDVLRLHDGRNGGGSLTIALRHHPKNLDIVRLLLNVNPNCIQVSDKRGNRPLHVACFHGTPLEVVQELYRHDPAAIDKTNMSGETPWEIVQRNSRLSSSPVTEFLYACTKRRERRLRKLTPPTHFNIKN